MSGGMRIELRVEDGKMFLKCIDAFEDIFGLSPKILEKNSLLDLLAPSEFKEHGEILDACFALYEEMSNEYEKTYKPALEGKKEAMKKL